MPQFQMNGKTEPDFRSLDSFTQGYIEALFFTECEEGTTRETWEPDTQSALPGDAGFSDISPRLLGYIKETCAAFQRDAGHLLFQAYERDYTAEQAGRDFWFTRNGLGVGYWDRDVLKPNNLGESLSEIARRFGEVWVSLGDDGQIY